MLMMVIIMQSGSNSFSILVPFSTINKKTAKNPQNSLSRSLSTIIAENEIRQQNLEYQRSLIRRKELQIKMEQLRNHYEKLMKKRRKADKVLEEAIARRDQALVECKQKRCYLEKYYEELNRKFRGGKDELFSNLARLEASLLEAYEKDEKRLRESLQAEEEEFARLVETVGMERERRDLLREEQARLEQSLDVDYLGNRRGGEQQASLRNENEYLLQNVQRVGREKKALQGEEKVLKRILNAEEEHRKHGAVIKAGIKKMFITKLKDQKYKAAVSQEYEKNLLRLRDMVISKRDEKAKLSSELAQKKAGLQAIIRSNQDRNREYGQLQQRLMAHSNK